MMCLKNIISLGIHNGRGVMPITPPLKFEKNDLETEEIHTSFKPLK